MPASQRHAHDFAEGMQIVATPAAIPVRPVPSWFPRAAQVVEEEQEEVEYQPLQANASGEAVTLRSILQSRAPVVETANLRSFTSSPRRPRLAAAPKSAPRNAAAYVGIGFMAALLGVGAGYLTSSIDDIKAQLGGSTVASNAPETIAAVPAAIAVAAPVAPVNATAIAKKPINIATLRVSDVSGEADTVIPLRLSAESVEAGQDLVLKISGVPEAAHLTAGEKTKDNDWKIAASAIGTLGLVVPMGGSAAKFDLEVSAVDSRTSELAAPIKAMTVNVAQPEQAAVEVPEPAVEVAATLEPAALEPPPPEPSATPEALKQMANGDKLMKSGDLERAREFYELAFTQGLPEAAIGVGKTFDPLVFAELKVQGMKPDPVRAMEWYMRARTAGAKGATAAIEALKKAPPKS